MDGRRGRRCEREIGDLVGEMPVLQVPQRGNDRMLCAQDRPYDRLEIEREPIVARAAPAREHDDVGFCARSAVHCIGHFDLGAFALNARRNEENLDVRCVGAHSSLKVGARVVVARNERNAAREQRNDAFSRSVKGPFGAKPQAQFLDLRRELPLTHERDGDRSQLIEGTVRPNLNAAGSADGQPLLQFREASYFARERKTTQHGFAFLERHVEISIGPVLEIGNLTDDGNALQRGVPRNHHREAARELADREFENPVVIHGWRRGCAGDSVGSGVAAGDGEPEGVDVGSGGMASGGEAYDGGTVG